MLMLISIAGVRLLTGSVGGGSLRQLDAVGGFGGLALWPPIVNVAAGAAVTANATCGDRTRTGSEEYCKLIIDASTAAHLK